MLWSSSFNRRFPVDTYVWVNYNDLTVLPHWNHGLFQGNHAQMAALFRLVKYYNLPIYIFPFVPQVHINPDLHIYTHHVAYPAVDVPIPFPDFQILLQHGHSCWTHVARIQL